MIRTGDEYRESLRDGREVWIDGERVDDVTTHPAFRPIVDVRARIYDMAHEAAHRRPHDLRRRRDRRALRRRLAAPAHQGATGTTSARAVDTVLDERRRRRHPRRRRDGRRDVVAGRRPGRAQRDRPAVLRPTSATTSTGPRLLDPFHVSANTDPKGDRAQAAAGPGPGRAAARRARDRQRHHRPRGQVRDRCGVRQPGVRQADDRRLGQRRPVGLRRGLPGRHGRAGHQAHLPVRLRRPRGPPRTTRCRTGSTRSTR